MNDHLRLNDGKNLQDRGKPTAKLDQKQPIEVREPDLTASLAPQHRHLMPQDHILCRNSALRLERRGQGGQAQP